MRKLFGGSVLLFLFLLPAVAEDVPKAELFSGYQYMRVGGIGGVNTNGWNASITGNVNRWFGVSGDFSGLYKNLAGISMSGMTFTCGPVVSLRRQGTTLFAHALFGGFRASAGFQGASGATTGFISMFGGGVDVKANRYISVRAFQLDWVRWQAMGLTQSANVRISTGVLFRFPAGPVR